jgi:CRISPR-associated protein (Cas_Cas02710)
MTDDKLAEAAEYEKAIPAELIQEYLRIRNEDIVKSKYHYFKELMPRINPLLESRPEHIAIRKAQHEEGFTTLVSLMGFSPETTVHAAVILRPKKLVIAYSDNAKESMRPAIEYLNREKIVDVLFDLGKVEIDAFDPQDIYDKLHFYIGGSGDTSRLTGRVIVDITGGTKLMSATAGALAWERNLRLCYLDGGWEPRQGASGLARASNIMIFRNPSRLRGYQRRKEAMDDYRRGNFVAAKEAFEESQRLIDDSFFDLLAVKLCETYCIIADFNRASLTEALDLLESTLTIGGVWKLCEGTVSIYPHIERLRSFARGDLHAMTAMLFELAEIYSNQARYDFAGLMFYRAMEALVQIGLRTHAPEFRMDKPDDWQAFPIRREDLERRYAELLPEENAVLPKREVTMLSGFGLLCLVDQEIAFRFKDIAYEDARNPKSIFRSAVGDLMGLAEIRNRSFLTHAFKTLSKEDCERLRDGSTRLARALLHEDFAEFEQLRSNMRPLSLDGLLSK